MNAELYLKKGRLNLKKKQYEKAIESLCLAIEIGNDDTVSQAKAHCLLGEYYFINHNYEKAAIHFQWISDNAEDLEAEWDDVLSDEINRADVLLDLLERFDLEVIL